MKKTIIVPKNTDLGTIKLNGKDEFLHISITAEEGSKAIIIEELSGNSDRRESVEIIAKQNSEIRFAAIQQLGECVNTVSRKAVVHKNANVEWLEIATGSSATKSETTSLLEGEGAKSKMFTVFFGNKKQEFDFKNRCIHTGKKTESLILGSGALKGSSKAVIGSFSKIGEKASNSSTHQKTRIMLMDEGTEALPVPELEIGNNEVSATHEASVGKIDEEKVFYLTSRGISENGARKTIIKGFFEEFVGRTDEPELREKIRNIIAMRIEND